MKRGLFGTILLIFCFNGYAQKKDSIVSELLILADSMPVNNGQLITLPNQGLFIADGNTFCSLDKEKSPHIEKFRVLENIPFEQVIVNDSDDGVIPIAEGEFHGLLHDGDIVYVVMKNGNIWRLTTM